MKIKFTKTQEVEAQGAVVQTFNAGEIYELSLSSAKRWLRRNVATEVQGAVKPVPSKSKPEKPVAKRKYVRKAPITSKVKPRFSGPENLPDTPSIPKSDDSNTGGRPEPDTGTGGPGKTSGNDSDK